MAKKPKVKVVIPESALKHVPEEDRERVTKTVLEAFEGADPSELGQPVERLPEGETVCPHCGGPLENGPSFPLPEGPVVQVFDCLECDKVFMREALN